MFNIRFYFILLSTLIANSQDLHHQAISSLGTSLITSKGIGISQTIGQQSIGGGGSNQSVYIVQQGFQQSYLLNNNFNFSTVKIETKMFPNPFNTFIYFQFSSQVYGEAEVFLFDDLGRKVYNEKGFIQFNRLKISPFATLPEGHYLVVLMTSNFNFRGHIIKSNL